MERQLVFDFIREDNLLQGRTCATCNHGEEGICNKFGDEVSSDHTCGDWEHNDDRAMQEIAKDARDEFIKLMKKYRIDEEDAKSIYINAQHF